jgi:hypothetical protein
MFHLMMSELWKQVEQINIYEWFSSIRGLGVHFWEFFTSFSGFVCDLWVCIALFIDLLRLINLSLIKYLKYDL